MSLTKMCSKCIVVVCEFDGAGGVVVAVGGHTEEILRSELDMIDWDLAAFFIAE